MQLIALKTRDFLRIVIGIIIVLYIQTELASQIIPTKPVSLIDHNLGLLSPYNFYIYKDSRGLVWICSISGLYQYNGKQLKVYKPDSNTLVNFEPQYIHSNFFEDVESNLWFGTWRGIICYQRNQDKFKSYLLPNTSPDSRFSVIGLDSLEKLWFIHNGGIFTFHILNKTFQHLTDIPVQLNNAELQLDEHGHVKYIYCYGRYKDRPGLHLCEFNDSELIRNISLFDEILMDSIAVSDIQPVSKTTFLIASTNGLYEYNWMTSTLKYLKQDHISDKIVVTSITPFRDSLYLIGMEKNGYFTLMANAGSYTYKEKFRIHCKGEVLDETPYSMYTDPEGAVWIYLFGRGVAYFHPKIQIFDYYPLDMKLEGKSVIYDANCIVEFDKNTVFATSSQYGGMYIDFENEKEIHASICNNCPAKIMNAFRDSIGRIWIFSLGRLFQLRQDKTILQMNQKRNLGHEFCELRDGRIINQSFGKLYLIEGQKKDAFFTRITSIDSMYQYHHINLLPDGLLYISATKKDSNYSIHLRAFDPENNFHLVKSNSVPWHITCALKIPKHNEYLIGTTTGLYFFNPLNWVYRPVDFTACNNGIIWNILPIRENEYLVCGGKCIEILYIEKKQAQRFSIENGLGMNASTWYGYLLHSSGKLFLGHKTGFSIADPLNLKFPRFKSNVNISSINVNDQLTIENIEKINGVINPNEINSLKLPYYQNTISFEFAALSYAGIDAHEYEYQLNHFDEKWVNGGKQGFVRYVNIPPGEYAFEVRVKNQPHTIRTIQLTIQPPFYRRLWFLILIGSLLSGIIYHLLKWRERRKQHIFQLKYEKQLALEQERLRISNNLHDDLGSGLSAINLKAQVLANQTKDPEHKNEFNQLASGLSKLAGQVREAIWSINASNDTVDNLLTRMHQHTIEYFEGSGIICKIHLTQRQVLQSISGHHRRELYLAYKEALHNIYKHANATEVSVNIDIDDSGSLLIRIQDNGKGFDVNSKYEGLGLCSMRKRLQEIGGNFSIYSTPQGTLIIMSYTV